DSRYSQPSRFQGPPRVAARRQEETMKLVDRYQAYAADFERTYADDDWSRLEQYFTEDATYSTPANGMSVSGRDTVLAVLRGSVTGFDRRCDSRTLATT